MLRFTIHFLEGQGIATQGWNKEGPKQYPENIPKLQHTHPHQKKNKPSTIKSRGHKTLKFERTTGLNLYNGIQHVHVT